MKGGSQRQDCCKMALCWPLLPWQVNCLLDSPVYVITSYWQFELLDSSYHRLFDYAFSVNTNAGALCRFWILNSSQNMRNYPNSTSCILIIHQQPGLTIMTCINHPWAFLHYPIHTAPLLMRIFLQVSNCGPWTQHYQPYSQPHGQSQSKALPSLSGSNTVMNI